MFLQQIFTRPGHTITAQTQNLQSLGGLCVVSLKFDNISKIYMENEMVSRKMSLNYPVRPQ